MQCRTNESRPKRRVLTVTRGRKASQPAQEARKQSRHIPLLPASTSTSTTKLFRLHPPRVRNQQRPIIRNQFLLQFHRAVRIDVFCVVCYEGFRDRLTDSVYLRGVSSSFDAHPDIEDGE